MPSMPPTLGRGAALDGGYDQRRRRVKPSRKWYGLARWQRRRAHQLALEPLCRMCSAEGVVTVATVADHVVPHREDAQRFWFGKLQSLCAPCHSSVKQSEERGGR